MINLDLIVKKLKVKSFDDGEISLNFEVDWNQIVDELLKSQTDEKMLHELLSKIDVEHLDEYYENEKKLKWYSDYGPQGKKYYTFVSGYRLEVELQLHGGEWAISMFDGEDEFSLEDYGHDIFFKDVRDAMKKAERIALSY